MNIKKRIFSFLFTLSIIFTLTGNIFAQDISNNQKSTSQNSISSTTYSTCTTPDAITIPISNLEPSETETIILPIDNIDSESTTDAIMSNQVMSKARAIFDLDNILKVTAYRSGDTIVVNILNIGVDPIDYVYISLTVIKNGNTYASPSKTEFDVNPFVPRTNSFTYPGFTAAYIRVWGMDNGIPSTVTELVVS